MSAPHHHDSELILNPDGSIYHLALHRDQVAQTIMLVGDPERVPLISERFDSIEHRVMKREFHTHTGRVGSTRLTVISTGIGTDNIDIVMTELDALFNVDPVSRTPSLTPQRLDFIRLGTSGGLQPECLPGTLLASSYGLGLDGLMHYYKRTESAGVRNLTKAFTDYIASKSVKLPIAPYFGQADPDLLTMYSSGLMAGITLTAPGFYGPQGRHIRIQPWREDILDILSGFGTSQMKLTNIEMETSAIYAMATTLGHRALSLNALLANRPTKSFSPNPRAVVTSLIDHFLSHFS
jgi:uridine phosphorylase